ncbi:MAG TPA: hypothetical protein VFW92_06300 [Candidatus Limnocylindrales bacterium]|nr:hypothetical protein [Candidatus Limnocylindrales bacterium]
MSHRHQAHRRRTYGRRQHELRERQLAPTGLDELEPSASTLEGTAWAGPLDGYDLPAELSDPNGAALRDLLGPRLRWAGGRS